MLKLKYITVLMLMLFLGVPNALAEKAPMTDNGDRLLFDFGAQYESGWIQVSEKTKYTKELGYGFSMISFIENSTAPGSGVLSDAIKVKYRLRYDTEFKVDLPEGIYEISVYSGAIKYLNINLEGYPAIYNIEHSNNEARIEIPVTDGTLDLQLEGGSSGTELAVSAVTVTRKSDVASRRKRVFICGDSIAATAYPLFLFQPLEESYAGGWGQMLGAYLPEQLYVHNISTAGAGTRTYISNNTIENRLHFSQNGDYVIIALGSNDKNSITAKEFTDNLENLIERIRNLGCKPILCSDAVQLTEYSGGKYADMCYAAQAQQLARELEIPFIDLHTAQAEYFSAIGYDAAQALFWRKWNGERDVTHPNRSGAGHIARLIAERLSAVDADFCGAVTDYGKSNDSRLKCKIDKNSVTLENTATTEIQLVLISPEHISKKLERVKEQKIILPPYDVLNPNQSLTVDLSAFNVGCPVYLLGDGINIKIK